MRYTEAKIREHKSNKRIKRRKTAFEEAEWRKQTRIELSISVPNMNQFVYSIGLLGGYINV